MALALRILLPLMLIVAAYAHPMVRLSVVKLKRQVQTLQKEQDKTIDKLTQLEKDYEAVLKASKQTPACTRSGGAVSVDVKTKDLNIGELEFEARLVQMEKDVDAIKKYLMVEKKDDIELKKKTKVIIKDMEEKVTETEQLIDGLKNNVKTSLVDFENMIQDVNTSAHLTINVRGVVFYGGVGSPCSYESGECQTADSECRDGRCQCLAGMSYNIVDRTCNPVCDSYGTTYQTIDHWFIRGYNNMTLENTTLSECRESCENIEDFVCRSFDFFPRWEQCFLSEFVKSEVPDDAWEYSSVGMHFQRDCGDVDTIINN